jgi:hypothetical protein
MKELRFTLGWSVMRRKKEASVTINLPHIAYTVFVRRFKRAPRRLPSALAYVEYRDENSCALYLPDGSTAGDIAHEIVHVLQKICLARNMTFTLEQEHMAYLMHYMMGRITGHSYDV